MADDKRLPREQELRVSEPVREEYPEYYENDTLLNTDYIPPREGYVQRWVRTSLQGREDQSNVYKKLNKSWRPRLLDSVPKGQYVPQIDFNGAQVIGIHGMVLMERPKALHERQKQAIRRDTENQMLAVKHNMYAEHDPRSGMRFSEERFETQTSVGRQPKVDD
jgi:hypothetical protein